jgi:hypothetical protein
MTIIAPGFITAGDAKLQFTSYYGLILSTRKKGNPPALLNRAPLLVAD